MVESAYDPDTGFTRDAGIVFWRFTGGHIPQYRPDAWEALMEAPEDAALLGWKSDDGEGVVPCDPMLKHFAEIMAAQAHGTNNLIHAEWATHWAVNAWNSPVRAARGAARHNLLAHHSGDGTKARICMEFESLCLKEKGIL